MKPFYKCQDTAKLVAYKRRDEVSGRRVKEREREREREKQKRLIVSLFVRVTQKDNGCRNQELTASTTSGPAEAW